MTESRDTSIVEARAALPLDGGVKCRQPTWAEDGGNRSVLQTRKPPNRRVDPQSLRFLVVEKVIAKRAKQKET